MQNVASYQKPPFSEWLKGDHVMSEAMDKAKEMLQALLNRSSAASHDSVFEFPSH